MSVFNELKNRGMIAQLTHQDKIIELLENKKISFYIGFDPTADSLHIGHFLQMMVMSHLQKAGHTPIVIIGGGTSMVGDPSGRSDMRKMLTLEQINSNAEKFKVQMSKLIDFSKGKALIIDNADWLLNLNYVNFLREVGVHFSVNRMLTADCFKTRLEKGLSFIEFNYMLMQSYDFLKLFQDYNCVMELGGDDQWSNIIGGIELVRRVEGKEVYGMTFTLLTTSEGKKMGKTQNGAIWLDPQKTTPYEFYQYFRNIDDADVIKCLKLLTFLPLDYINELSKLKDNEINKCKEILAFEVTKLVHNENEAIKAQNTAKALFSSGGNKEDMPVASLNDNDFDNEQINILDLLVKIKISPSKGEGRRLIEQGGISVDEKKILNFTENIQKEKINSENGIIVRKGKKVFIRVKHL